MKIERTKDPSKVREFITKAESSLRTFRYFDKRPPECISAHIVTLVGCEEDDPIVYGHLDQEDGKVWLGICVRKSSCGKGLGVMMMDALVEEAKTRGITRIDLTVDADNTGARKLYERYGFVFEEQKGNVVFYARGDK